MFSTSLMTPSMPITTFNELDHTQRMRSTTIIFNGIENDGDEAKGSEPKLHLVLLLMKIMSIQRVWFGRLGFVYKLDEGLILIYNDRQKI